MIRNEGGFHRAPRPLTMWATTFLVIVLVLFVTAVLAAIAVGFWLTAAEGESVPNLTGGLENFGAVLVAIFGAGGIGTFIFNQRHVERLDQQARGTAPNAPFAPPPPSGAPSDEWQGVNPHGGPGAP